MKITEEARTNKKILEFTNSLSDNDIWKKMQKPNDSWKDDQVFQNYHSLSPGGKGKLGEYYVEEFMKILGSNVMPALNKGHDRIIDGHKTEIKFALAKKENGAIKRNHYNINHVGIYKDWDRIIVVLVNPNNPSPEPNMDRARIFWQSKKDFKRYSFQNGIFVHQQGGKKSENDDYMCAGKKNIEKWINLSSVKHICQWKDSR